MTGPISSATGSLTGLIAKATLAGGALLGIGSAAGALGFGVKLAADYEQAEVAMTTLLGSADQAKQLLGDLSDFAASTPFQFPELQDSARKLVAFGVAGENTVPTLRMIGDIAAGTGNSIGDLAEIYGKARVQGRLMAEDINQLTGRGIPIIQELAKQFGVAESEVKNLVSKGSVNFGNLQQAFASLTGEGGRFSGMMEAQSHTLSGLFSTLKDNVGNALRDISMNLLTAIDAKGLMAKAIEMTAGIGSVLTGLVGKVVQIGGQIVGFVGPWVTWIKDTIVTGFQSFVSGGMTLFLQLYNTGKSIFMTLTSVIGGAFMSISSWISGLLPSFESCVGWFKWFRDLAVKALLTVEWSVTHWRQLLEQGLLIAAHGVVKFANEIQYFFGTVIPGVISWLADNWQSILTDMANFQLTVFGNIARNIWNFVKNLPGLISGSVNFSEIWTPLTDGFKATLKELPQYADRVAGPLEKALSDQITANSKSLGNDYASFIQDRMKELEQQSADVQASLANPFGGESGQPKATVTQTLMLDQPSQDAINGFTTATSKRQDVGALEKGTAAAFSAERAGSAIASGLAKAQEKTAEAARETNRKLDQAIAAIKDVNKFEVVSMA